MGLHTVIDPTAGSESAPLSDSEGYEPQVGWIESHGAIGEKDAPPGDRRRTAYRRPYQTRTGREWVPTN